MTQVVVLAGGLATRMLPRTERVPKLLLEVGGRPFIEHLLRRLRESGVDHVLLLTGHLGAAVDEHLRALDPDGLRVTVRSDGPRLLGTAGALKAAEDLLEDTFVVTYGDSYLRFDYREPLDRLVGDGSALGCMAVFPNFGALEPSNARVETGHVVAYDKASSDARFDHVDYGATALKKDVVRAIPAGESVPFSDVQRDLAARGVLLAHVVSDRFYEIGSPAGLAALESHLAGSVAP